MIRDRFVDDVLGPRLKLSKAVQNAVSVGSDLKKRKGRSAKNKRLVMFPGLLGLSQSTQDVELGKIENFLGPNPSLTVTFPDGGRLRFVGRLVHPDQRYMAVNFERKGDAACKELFDSIVVFDKFYWIGTSEENPDDKVRTISLIRSCAVVCL